MSKPINKPTNSKPTRDNHSVYERSSSSDYSPKRDIIQKGKVAPIISSLPPRKPGGTKDK